MNWVSLLITRRAYFVFTSLFIYGGLLANAVAIVAGLGHMGTKHALNPAKAPYIFAFLLGVFSAAFWYLAVVFQFALPKNIYLPGLCNLAAAVFAMGAACYAAPAGWQTSVATVGS